MNDFTTKVISLIKRIPRGRVASYGQIAALAGKPHGSRGVAWILNSSSPKHKLPWHRVINSQGKISLPISRGGHRQKQLLLKEGVVFSEGERIDLLKFQWKKKVQKPKRKIRSLRYL